MTIQQRITTRCKLGKFQALIGDDDTEAHEIEEEVTARIEDPIEETVLEPGTSTILDSMVKRDLNARAAEMEENSKLGLSAQNAAITNGTRKRNIEKLASNRKFKFLFRGKPELNREEYYKGFHANMMTAIKFGIKDGCGPFIATMIIIPIFSLLMFLIFNVKSTEAFVFSIIGAVILGIATLITFMTGLSDTKCNFRKFNQDTSHLELTAPERLVMIDLMRLGIFQNIEIITWFDRRVIVGHTLGENENNETYLAYYKQGPC